MMTEDVLAQLLRKIEGLEHELHELKSTTQSIRQLVGPFAATFPDGSMLVQSLHGIKYFIDPDDMIIAPQMVIYRQWEAELSKLFRSLCTPDSVLVDVGANFGYFTCLAGTYIGRQGSGKVFSFEPNPKLAQLLRRNLEINWSMAPVSFHEVAAADFDGEVLLHIPQAHSANASLSASVSPDADHIPVYAVRLDHVIPVDVQVDVMKIDVEGHEYGVLKGAKEVIERSPTIRIIMEWSRSQMAQANVDPNDILNFFREFHCYRIESEGEPFSHRESAEWLLSQDYVDVMMCRQ